MDKSNSIRILFGWIESMRAISDSRARAELAEAIINYAYDATPYTGDNEMVKVLMVTIAHSIDYRREQSERNAANGRKGGNPALSVNRPDNPVIEKEIEMKKEEKKKTVKVFVKPTVEEVEEYCRSRNNGVDAQHFCDFYTSKGWKVGKESMKDWRACVRTWEKRDPGRAPKSAEPRFDFGGVHDIDVNAL